MTSKDDDAYKSISEVAEMLNLVNPKTGRISQQGSVTIDRNIDLDEPYNKPIPNDPWDKPAVQKHPAPKPKPGVTIRRPTTLGSDW